MVKGISKQVIVVHPTKQDFFEQAIFIVKPEMVKEGISESRIWEDAKMVLRDMNPNSFFNREWVRSAFFAVLGAAVSTGIWMACTLL